MPDPLSSQRHQVLEAFLPLVPFEGWSDTALRHACLEIGLNAAMKEILFPHGPKDMARLFIAHIDTQMAEKLSPEFMHNIRVRDRIKTAIITRLELMAPYRASIQCLLRFYALPTNLQDATHTLWHTADTMWYLAGDTATDYNFYSKRMLLSSVYSSTLLFWIGDDSKDYADTLAFLDRRIEDVMTIGKIKKQCRSLIPSWLSVDNILERISR